MVVDGCTPEKSGFVWALLEYLASKTPTPIFQDLEAEVWSRSLSRSLVKIWKLKCGLYFEGEF